MKLPRIAILSGIAFLTSACALFVFLTKNEPDTVSAEAISKFGWFVLSPITFLFALCSRPMFWLTTLSIIAGIFIGVCVRCILPPVASNIWPIAAAFWTAHFFLPVVAGSATGGLVGWLLGKVLK